MRWRSYPEQIQARVYNSRWMKALMLIRKWRAYVHSVSRFSFLLNQKKVSGFASYAPSYGGPGSQK